MIRKLLRIQVVVAMLAGVLPLAHARSVQLQSVAFPEKQNVTVLLSAEPIAPTARLRAEVTYRQGQARIELDYEGMKPAILFGGDVTCFVVWAVTRDGVPENLGELLTSRPGGRLTFYTAQKQFALMVTAESYYLVRRPSELLVFRNTSVAGSTVPTSRFTFDRFTAAPRHSMDAIAHLKWDSRVPLELLQARKAYELATRHEAAVHAPKIHTEAKQALDIANGLAQRSPRSRQLTDAARRAVAASNEALNMSLRRIEAIEAQAEAARRREEAAALERRASEAEIGEQEAQALATELRQEAARIRVDRTRLLSETNALRTEKASLESGMDLLRQEKLELQREKAALEQEALRLAREKAELSGRLESALSHVADTTDSARGFVVNLPDILFDVNESTLKHEAQLTIAKLAGILLILPEQRILIEGHTDSTGSAAYNLDLSRRRAEAVMSLLRAQGIDATRLRAEGFGMNQPVADNTSAEGRRRNRRVEIIISDGSRNVASN